MPFFSILLLAFSMSCDAFAAALCKGAVIRRPTLSDALRIGLIFGIIETITPMLGWLIGRSVASYVEQWDHWIAFGLLLMLGLHMIHEGLSKNEVADDDCNSAQLSLPRLILTGLSTSIDAMAVGAGLAFAGVNIITTALAIGTATFLMATIGVMLGGVLGKMVGKRAEIVGGIVLIGIGTTILLEHTGHLG
ncbi:MULTISPECIES: manganese efflux pump MntP [Cobetia]|uniref:Putative manganese efflux pump MntP n=1 Tax=Cobetia crustatorum TaxID=553385 RepID=A0A558HLP7_9GAMM|nr:MULTISPECIES: manganese efflux pump MntP family protein [Cobetia]TVU70069.1 manganese efflux pump MntP family protein [Cobetia crustatorum]